MKIKRIISGGVTVLASTMVLLGAAGPASAADSAATPAPDTQTCWGDVATGNTACAATDEELAVKIFDEFNTVIQGDAPASLKLSESERASISPKS